MPVPKRTLNRVGVAAWPEDAVPFPDAPADGAHYTRKDEAWETLPPCVEEAPDEATAEALSALEPGVLYVVPEEE